VPGLVLGPILRYADDRVATVWVQADAACEVAVLGHATRTWCVEGEHFALVAIDGLTPGQDTPYEVHLDGERVWPEPDASFPPSTIRLLDPDAERDVVFGSCRITRPHEPPYVLRSAEHPDGQGVDALRQYALRAASSGRLPDLLLMLGDQIYADQPSPALAEALTARAADRPADAPPDELADFCDYSLAYREAWSADPAIRWLLSTVPTTMVFDDHEIHAEWRISQGWLDEMNAEPWFDRHIRAGLMAYWVFQHIGNLSPATLAEGELYDKVRDRQGDAGALLAGHMDTEGRQTGHSRWSFARDLGGGTRLVVIDSRAGRDVTPGARELIREQEWRWIREQASRPTRHLLLASSVPFLLTPGLHHVEAFDEALTDGAWGRVGVALGEQLRRIAVLDHWASFQRTFRRLAELLDDVAHGRVGQDAPSTVVMLSGDVHHCYLAEVGFRPGGGAHAPVWQAVCSAFRKELAPHERRIIAFGHTPLGERLARRLARRAGVPPLPLDWRVTDRPAYANQVGTLSIDGGHARVSVEAIADGDWRDAELTLAFARELS
jgi:PhoD-like phosphatase